MSDFHLCPECGSGKIELGDLVGDDMTATCTNCSWTGPHRELLSASPEEVAPSGIIEPDMALAIAEDVAKAYMILLAKHAGQPIGLAMVQAGVIGAKDPQVMGRLIRAACQGAYKATLDEVDQMQKEMQSAERPAN